MKLVIQRVLGASVSVESHIIGEIGNGLLVLVGIARTDTTEEVEWMADKLTSLRVFADDAGKMNLSVKDVGGGLLMVSQFTLYGTLTKGTRPSFTKAADPSHALHLYNALIQSIRGRVPELTVECGEFGAMMDVRLLNHGPVTLVLERNSTTDSEPL